MVGNITKVQQEEEGGKGRKYGDTVTLCLLSFTGADRTPTSLTARKCFSRLLLTKNRT